MANIILTAATAPSGGGSSTPAKVPKGDVVKNVKVPVSDTILSVAVELLAVGLFTLIAGASNQFGTVVVIFMLGLWLLYLLTDSQVVTNLVTSLTKVA